MSENGFSEDLGRGFNKDVAKCQDEHTDPICGVERLCGSAGLCFSSSNGTDLPRDCRANRETGKQEALLV